MRYITKPSYSVFVLLTEWLILLMGICLGFVASRGFWFTFLGLMLGVILLIVGIGIVTVTHTLIWIVARWLNPIPRVYRMILLTPPILLSLGIIGVVAYDFNPERHFRQYLISPIPASVHSIRARGFREMLVDEEVIDFAISPNDASKVLEAMQFEPIGSTIPAEVTRMAKRHLRVDLKSLGAVSIFEAPAIPQNPQSDYSEARYIVVNQARDRMMFFLIAGS